MSEYQYYEFLALDHRLTKEQMVYLRSISSRAQITSTSFVNEYHWGSFRGDVDSILAEYYDAFVYYANWGTHDLRFRLPRADFDEALARQYFTEYSELREVDEDYILSFMSDDESGGDFIWDEDCGWMPSLAPLREDLLAGDMRSLYLAWLAYTESGYMDEDEIEPTVPPGIGELTVSLQTLAEFLRIDDSLIEAAAQDCTPLTESSDSIEEFNRWISSLPVGEKDALLCQLAEDSPVSVQRELTRRFQRERKQGQSLQKQKSPKTKRRTIKQLRQACEELQEQKRHKEAEKRTQEKARKQAQATQAQQKRLDQLSTQQAQSWEKVESLIEQRHATPYSQAVNILLDLHALAKREGKAAETEIRLVALRNTHRGKVSFIRRLTETGL